MDVFQMRRRKSYGIMGVILVIIASLSLVLTYLRDCPFEVTPMSAINAGMTPLGTNVTVKGEITGGIEYLVLPNFYELVVSDRNGELTIASVGVYLEVGWTIIVRGTVYSNTSLHQ